MKPTNEQDMINPSAKTCEQLNLFNNDGKLVLGLGTNLSNNLDHNNMNIAMKITSCNSSAAKLSDSEGQVLCHEEAYLTYLEQIFAIK